MRFCPRVLAQPSLVNTDDGNNDTEIFENIYHNGTFGTEGPKLIGQITAVPSGDPSDVNEFAYLGMNQLNSTSPTLFVCPQFFRYTLISDLVNDQETKDIICTYLGDYTSMRMDSVATIILHEYIHFKALVSPPLTYGVHGNLQKRPGPYKAQHITKRTARYNPESYAWYATEVFWTIHCGTFFLSPPSDDYDQDPPLYIPRHP